MIDPRRRIARNELHFYARNSIDHFQNQINLNEARVLLLCCYSVNDESGQLRTDWATCWTRIER
jgi:hypothetical protein